MSIIVNSVKTTVIIIIITKNNNNHTIFNKLKILD